MEIICPACNKKNESDSCMRCGCDLTPLRIILTAAGLYLRNAKSELQKSDWVAALKQAERSWNLVHSPESAFLACLAAAAGGETAALVRWRQRTETETGS